jgi:hypothetical protein
LRSLKTFIIKLFIKKKLKKTFKKMTNNGNDLQFRGPTLTDHFKQALNMNRAQLQNSPSAISSAAHLGLINPNGNNISNNINTTHKLLPEYVNSNNNMDQIFGSRYQQQDIESVGFLQNYGKWIVMGVVIIILSIAGWIWWKKQNQNQNNINNNEIEKMFSRRNLKRIGEPRMDQSDQQPYPIQYPLPLPPLNNNNNNNNRSAQEEGQGQLHYATGLPTFQNTLKDQQKSIREKEQDVSMRGAEFSNPNFMSTIRPQLPESRRESLYPSDAVPRQSLYPPPPQQFQSPQQPPQQQPPQQQFQSPPPLPPPQQQQPQQQFQSDPNLTPI